jgi:formylglycine-generating enzyme required for sulfatase activity
MMFAKALLRGFLAAAVLASAVAASAQGVFNMPGNETSLQFVTVGNPGNAADPATGSLYGAVGYTYRMGTYDVTTAQYCQFLNAVATTSDPYGLYNSNMATDFPNYLGVSLGIAQGGSAGSYSYSVMGNGNVPVFDVTWGDAARFCNWLQNGQLTVAQGGLAITETGAYTLSGATSNAALMLINRNAGAKYFIPSENEWYKAAYYSPTLNSGAGGYWTYPTKSNTAPINVPSSTGTNNANFYDSYGTGNGGYTDSTNYLTPVGYFAGSPGPYGTYDMGGDVWQWNEANISNSYRGARGGSFDGYSYDLASPYRGYFSNPSLESYDIGFRVAGTPEPGSITLLVAGAIAGLMCWRRWR